MSKIFRRKPMLPDWHKKARCDFISYCVRVSVIPMLQMLHWRSSKQTAMCTCLWDQNETIKNGVWTHTKPESALKTSREASISDSTDTDRTKWTLCVGTAQLINLRLQTSHDYCHSFVSGGSVTRDRFHFFLFHSFPFLPPSCFPSLLSSPFLPFISCLRCMFASMQKGVRLWRPEQDTSYMPVSLSTWSLTVLVILTRLAARLVFRVHWSRSPMLRIWTQALWLQSRDSYPQRHFPSLGKHFPSWFGSCSYGWMQRVKANGLNA